MWEMLDQFKIVLSLGREIIIPLCIGSTVVGLVAAAVVYGISQRLLRFMIERHELRRARLNHDTDSHRT